MAPSSSRDNVIGSATWSCRAPFGPLTDTFWPSIVTSTPDGMGIGCLPIRDMSSTPSPHAREDLSADALPGGLAVGQQTGRGVDDRDTQPAEHSRQVGRLGVHAQAGLGNPAQAGNAALAARGGLQFAPKGPRHAGVLGAVVGDG